ncbi:hypothetical protein BJV82DRAFT_609768 [Fennellomyces sp. T-0311]|nr:hypothetical protein BJV82DRAFT_609768 [Fennellomyces sp. T-0311]
MRFDTIVATAAIYFAVTHAIPIPDEPAAPQSNPLVQNLAVPQLNVDSLLSGAGGGTGGAGGGGAIGKVAIIARRKKRGEQAPPPGPVGGVMNTVTGSAGGVTTPVTAKTDPPLTNAVLATEALQSAANPIPPSDQAGLGTQFTGTTADLSGIAGAVDGLGLVQAGGGGGKKKQA